MILSVALYNFYTKYAYNKYYITYIFIYELIN